MRIGSASLCPPVSGGQGVAPSEQIVQATARIRRLIEMPPEVWTQGDLEAVGVEPTSARVLIDHLRQTELMSSEFLVRTLSETTREALALKTLGNGMDPHYAHAYESTRGDGAAVAILIGQAIKVKDLACLRATQGENGGGFVQGLLDLFVEYRRIGSKRLSPTGIGNVVTALSILVECGAAIDADAFDGVPPLIYAVSRGAPAEVLDVLVKHGANPNDIMMRTDVSGPACGLDYLVGGTAMHHAMLAGDGTVSKSLFVTHGGRLDITTAHGYTPISVAGAAARPLPGPRDGLLESAVLAVYAWVVTDADPVRRCASGEHLAQVLATRLLEMDRAVTAAELHIWLGAMDLLNRDVLDISPALNTSPAQGGATYKVRLHEMFRLWYGDNSREAQPLSEWPKIEAAIGVNEWLHSLPRPDGTTRFSPRTSHPVMRATEGPLCGDAPQAPEPVLRRRFSSASTLPDVPDSPGLTR